MSITIPTETLRDLVQRPNDLQREIVIAMYQAGDLTGGKAREMLGLTVTAWDALCSERKLRGSYDVDDLEKDIATMKELKRW